MKRLTIIVFIILILTAFGIIYSTHGVIASASTSSNTTYFIAGDANNDGVINMADVTYIERALLGLSPITAGCDANRNGNFSVGDITKTERYILGLDWTVGDVNHDGQVNQLDIKVLENMMLGLVSKNNEADVNMDGIVSSADLTVLGIMINKN